jgi:UDP-N-acetylmuramate--alanine ligase
MHGKSLKIFFSGIGGSGVSAIASFMADRGHVVVGSDRAFDMNPSHPLKRIFQSRGIAIVPQDGNGIDNTFDLVVFSTAVEPDQPEVLRAKAQGISIKTRAECLAEITSSFNTIAISGTSGKSTASGLLAFLMERLGLNPNFIGGGRVKQFKSSINPGNSLTGDSEYLIIEACESDGTIVNYKPEHSIILNLALDHHHSVNKTAKLFETLVENTAKKVIVNADDDNLRKITSSNAITFSIHNPSNYRAEAISYSSFSTDFSLSEIRSEHKMRFSLSLPGEYNLYNALSCIALLSEIGISLSAIRDVLPEFKGIDRRFDILLNNRKGLVIDDYAHNPHKLLALIKTVKQLRERICYIFQPHGFAPTRLMKKEYIKVFTENLRDSDHLILLPIFYAGGSVSKDISSHDLADEIRAQGKSVEIIEERKDILKGLREYRSYVILGARDETLSDFAKEIARAISTEKV